MGDPGDQLNRYTMSSVVVNMVVMSCPVGQRALRRCSGEGERDKQPPAHVGGRSVQIRDC